MENPPDQPIPSVAQPKPKTARKKYGSDPLAATLQNTIFEQGALTANYDRFHLGSVFQPIYSLSHQRPVGCEALVRAHDNTGIDVPPPLLFGCANRTPDLIHLDRLCRTLHVGNFQALNSPAWLFLNINPMVVIHGRKRGHFFRDMLDHFHFPVHQVVVEILENAIANEEVLEEAVHYYRDQGCLVAVDDFGAGHSNFERIWRLEPDIVKLDRRMIAEATRRDLIRRSLPGLVSLLHEAGCMVLAEGVETEEEAMLMLDANVDLAQGHLFAHPFPINDPRAMDLPTLRGIHMRFIDHSNQQTQEARRKMAPYIQAFDQAVKALLSGGNVETITERLFRLERGIRFYMLDTHGGQSTHNINHESKRHKSDPRLQPLSVAKGANWFQRPYFRQAVDHPGEIQVTRPYLSLPDGRMCITLSICTDVEGQRRVLCFDIDDENP
ncbi:MAG TPA: EAL domain-containing protein [Gammaproteobacteria bacterium]|nr:EAL domain-containing protein [Gammaproteobacteria bacterium]